MKALPLITLTLLLSIAGLTPLAAASPYDAVQAQAMIRQDERSLAQAQQAGTTNYPEAKTALRQIVNLSGNLLVMSPPAGVSPERWKQLNESVELAAIHGYEAAKHKNATDLAAALTALAPSLSKLRNQLGL
jgi:hypothetical protein